MPISQRHSATCTSSPAALESAIRLLDQPVSSLRWGDIGETADFRSVTC